MNKVFLLILFVSAYCLLACTKGSSTETAIGDLLSANKKLIKVHVNLHQTGNYPAFSKLEIERVNYPAKDSLRPIFGSSGGLYYNIIPSQDTLIKTATEVLTNEDSKLYITWKVHSPNLDSLSGGKTQPQLITKNNMDGIFRYEINY